MNRIHAPYLVVGFSVAGRWGARAIRSRDAKKKIVVVSEEEFYSRPLITYSLGKKAKDITYRETIVDESHVDILWGKRVESLDTSRKVAWLQDGTQISFDRALIATGGVPIIPSLHGMDKKGIFSFTRSEDLRKIQEFLRDFPVERVLVLGGGFIGLKTCEAFLHLGLPIVLVELSSRLLPTMLDEEGSRYLEEALSRNGVRVITQDTVEEFRGDRDRLEEVLLRSGEIIPVGMAAVAIGVKPNVEWLRNSGLNIRRGVVVNEFQETSVRGIFAAGDVAETKNLITGEYNVVAIWPEAVRQGKVAGWNMVGAVTSYPGSLPVNSLDLGGLALVSAGIVNPPQEWGGEVLVKREPEEYLKVVLRNNVIVGMVMVGRIERAGLYIHLMRERIVVSDFKNKLLEKNFGLVNLPKDYRKHLVEGVGVEV